MSVQNEECQSRELGVQICRKCSNKKYDIDLQQQQLKQVAPPSSPRALRARAIQPNFRSKVVIGVLGKWVGYLSGYRSRMVVLENGCLRIYKIHGPLGVSLEDLIPEHLKTQVTMIGSQVVEAREKFQQQDSGPDGHGVDVVTCKYSIPNVATDELDLKDFEVRRTRSCGDVFILSKTTCKPLQFKFKAATPEEANIWIQALRGERWNRCLPELTKSYLPDVDDALDYITDMVSRGLAPSFIRSKAKKYLTGFLGNLVKQRVQEAETRRSLMDYIYALEQERNELEEMVISCRFVPPEGAGSFDPPVLFDDCRYANGSEGTLSMDESPQMRGCYAICNNTEPFKARNEEDVFYDALQKVEDDADDSHHSDQQSITKPVVPNEPPRTTTIRRRISLPEPQEELKQVATGAVQ